MTSTLGDTNMDAVGLDLTTAKGKTTLWVNSERVDECVAYYLTHPIDTLGVSPMRGYARKDIDFLREHPKVTALTLVSPATGDFDLAPVRSLHSLRSLTVSAPLLLPLGEFEHLESARGVWHPSLDLLGCKHLRILALTGYKPKSRDLTGLPELPALRELALVQTNVESVQGIRVFQQLRRLELAYATKLQELSELDQLTHLEELHCEKCGNLRLESLTALKGLRSLRLNFCGEIPTLKFLDDMPGLEEFRFVNTNVVDGDLRPLLRLKWAGFLPKKHYSHTPEQVDAILRPKGGGAIPRVE